MHDDVLTACLPDYHAWCRDNLYAAVLLLPRLGKGTSTYHTLHYACKYGEIISINKDNQLAKVQYNGKLLCMWLCAGSPEAHHV